MNNFLKTINYYLLLLLGLSGVSWLIWSRFIRERAIRNIPDELFTELRFWILLYICIIYLYIIKNLVKPKEPNIILQHLVDMLYKPFIILDHLFKYNKYFREWYMKNILKLVDHLLYWNIKTLTIFFYAFQIIPRFILITFLVRDIFYVHRLELFYKIILIGLLPFIFRYILYCFKNFYETLIKDLENNYDQILIFENGYDYDLSRKRDTSAKYHYEFVSMKEYIEIKFENWIEYNLDKIDFEYIGFAYCKEEIFMQYRITKYQNSTAILTNEDYDEMRKLFHKTMPSILDFKLFLNRLNSIKNNLTMKWCKIIIFGTYFICWFFVLSISYYIYPIQFNLMQIFIENIHIYLGVMNDSFNITEVQSHTKIINIIIKIIVSKWS